MVEAGSAIADLKNHHTSSRVAVDIDQHWNVKMNAGRKSVVGIANLNVTHRSLGILGGHTANCTRTLADTVLPADTWRVFGRAAGSRCDKTVTGSGAFARGQINAWVDLQAQCTSMA